jgi:hypothetical protein
MASRNGEHDRLPRYVPPICESCYCPVTVTAFQPSFIATNHWPGTHGIRVYLHTACAAEAVNVKRVKR